MTLEIAERLCAYRKSRGFSQEELAEKIGVSRQAISKWERGEATPDTENLILLAQIYNVTIDDLLNTDPIEQAPPEKDFVSFKNGIHIHSKDGDHVDIDLSGVHVDTKNGERVHVGHNGIHVSENGHIHTVTDENGKILWSEDSRRWYRIWKKIPWPILCCLAYLLLGFTVAGSWSWGWLVFLTVPLYYSLGDAIARRNPNHFAYPVLVALVYLALGLFQSLWHPGWILFLTVPIYYGICVLFHK